MLGNELFMQLCIHENVNETLKGDIFEKIISYFFINIFYGTTFFWAKHYRYT